jgi:hypothetical protein
MANDSYDGSHVLTDIILSLAPLRLLLADLASPRGLAYGFPRVRFRKLQTGRLLILHVPVGAADGTAGSKNSLSCDFHVAPTCAT